MDIVESFQICPLTLLKYFPNLVTLWTFDTFLIIFVKKKQREIFLMSFRDFYSFFKQIYAVEKLLTEQNFDELSSGKIIFLHSVMLPGNLEHSIRPSQTFQV